MKRLPLIAALLLTAGASYAAGEAKAPRLVACSAGADSVARLPSGAAVGICPARHEGGKVTFLRSFVVVKVLNPATGRDESAMVGFQ